MNYIVINVGEVGAVSDTNLQFGSGKDNWNLI